MQYVCAQGEPGNEARISGMSQDGESSLVPRPSLRQFLPFLHTASDQKLEAGTPESLTEQDSAWVIRLKLIPNQQHKKEQRRATVAGLVASSPLSCKLSLVGTSLLLLCRTLGPQLLHLSHKPPPCSLIRLQELCLEREKRRTRGHRSTVKSNHNACYFLTQ